MMQFFCVPTHRAQPSTTPSIRHCVYFVVVRVVVLTLTHNTMQYVVAGQAPITLEWKKYVGSQTEAKTKNKDTHSPTADTKEAKRRLFTADKKTKMKMKRSKKN